METDNLYTRLLGWKMTGGISPTNNRCGHCNGTLTENTEEHVISNGSRVRYTYITRMRRHLVCLLCGREIEFSPIAEDEEIAPDLLPLKRGRPTKREVERRLAEQGKS